MAVIDDPNDYNGHELVVVAAVFLSFTTVAVLLRCYTRLFITKFFKLDDWLMLTAQVCLPISLHHSYLLTLTDCIHDNLRFRLRWRAFWTRSTQPQRS